MMPAHRILLHRRRFLLRRIFKGAESSLLIHDQFTDTDSVSLDAHAIAPINTPSTSWSEVWGGNWYILSNKAVHSLNSESIALCDAGIADCTLDCNAKSVEAGSGGAIRYVGIYARGNSTPTGWKIGINAYNDNFAIIEQNGPRTLRANTTLTLDVGTEYAIQVVLSGQNIVATLDGANEISYGSAALNETLTTHGITSYNATNDTVDEFKVTG